MKNDKIVKIISVISAFVLVAGLLCVYGAVQNGKTLLLAVGIPCIILAVGGMVASFIIKLKDDKKVKSSWVEYSKLPKIEIKDFKSEIEKVRENFAADSSAEKNRFPKPNFNGIKPISDFSVIDDGKIYYGYLIQANEAIFTRSRASASPVVAADVAYSTDEYYDKKPYELKDIAEGIYANKENNSLKNEKRYFTNIKLEGELTGGRDVYMSTLMLYRNHLPFGFMSGALFPVIAAPGKRTSVFAVDCKYWTDALVSNFMYDDANYKEKDIFNDFEE